VGELIALPDSQLVSKEPLRGKRRERNKGVGMEGRKAGKEREGRGV